MKLPELLWTEVQAVGWKYQSWLQAEHGVNDRDDEEETIEEVVQTKEIDLENLKPGVKLLKMKVAKWKENDHYAILGLQDLRFHATTRQIRQVQRALSLKYHPDKLGRPATKKDEEAFAVITKSAELLTDPVTRRHYDSIDPKNDDSLPKGKAKMLKENFYSIFPEYFERNSRWSYKMSEVPKLGDANATREEVEAFYEYWYEFKSWRDYHWEDEEDIESAQDRYEKREIEKFNRSARQKKKKVEMARIRKLVDMAYDNDPRIEKFRNDDREERAAAKKAAKMEKYKEKIEAAKLKEEEEAKKKAEEEEKARILAEAEAQKKKDAKAAVNATKKQRKILRQLAKSHDYWVEEDDKLEMMENIEYLCSQYKSDKLSTLNEQLAKMEIHEQPAYVTRETKRLKEEIDAKWVK